MECKGLKLIPLHRSPLASARGGRCIALPPASFNSGRFSAYEPVVITSTVPGRPFAVCWIRPLKVSAEIERQKTTKQHHFTAVVIHVFLANGLVRCTE